MLPGHRTLFSLLLLIHTSRNQEERKSESGDHIRPILSMTFRVLKMFLYHIFVYVWGPERAWIWAWLRKNNFLRKLLKRNFKCWVFLQKSKRTISLPSTTLIKRNILLSVWVGYPNAMRSEAFPTEAPEKRVSLALWCPQLNYCSHVSWSNREVNLSCEFHTMLKKNPKNNISSI